MKSQHGPTKSPSFQLVFPLEKARKTKSMRPELPGSQHRKIPADDGVLRRSQRLVEKFEFSVESAPEASGTKRRVLTDAPVKVKRFKTSGGRSVQYLKDGRDDLLKDRQLLQRKTEELNVKFEQVFQEAEEIRVKTETFDEQTEETHVKTETFDEQTEETHVKIESNDVETEEDADGIENYQDPTGQVVDTENGDVENQQAAELEWKPYLESTTALQADESLAESKSDPSVVENDQPNLGPEVDGAGILLQNQDEEMEDDEDENSIDSADASTETSDVDMSLESMASSSQIIRDFDTNKTSLGRSILAGPSNRVENSSVSSLMMPQDSERIRQSQQRVIKIECVVTAYDGKETIVTHESRRNCSLRLSSADAAPNVICSDENMLDSLFHDEGNEELERMLLTWYKTQQRTQQCDSGLNRWNLVDDYSKLVTILVIGLAFFILFVISDRF